MSLPRIIGITGRAGAGKDTLADYFVREHGYVKLSFAEPLKVAVKERFALADDDFDRDVKDEPFECFGFSADYDGGEIRLDEYFSLRSWLQWLGTDFARKLFGEDCWVYLLSNRMDEYDSDQKFVISDVRFENEADFVREGGGVLFHIKREGLETDGHRSEAGVRANRSDLVIWNSGSIAELEQFAAELLGIEPPVFTEAEPFIWSDYIDFVNSTWIDGQKDEDAHAALGLAEEAGEVGGLFKRMFRGDSEQVDSAKLQKELGDVIYYWAKVCELNGLSPEDVIAANVEKITDRKERGQLRGTGSDR